MGRPISSCLCFISCLLGRPEPGSPGQPACPQGAKDSQSPGDNDGKGVLSRAARLLPPLRPPERPHNSHPTGKTPVPGAAGIFLQGPLAEAVGAGKGRGAGARLSLQALALSAGLGGLTLCAQVGSASPSLASWTKEPRPETLPPNPPQECKWGWAGLSESLSNLHQPPLVL